MNKLETVLYKIDEIWDRAFDTYADVWHDQRKKLAAQDSTWTEIEARRHNGGPGIIFLSEKYNLGIKEWDIQSEIADSYLARNWAYRLKWWLDEYSPYTIYWKTKSFIHRGKHGWAPYDTYSFDYYLAKVLAEALGYFGNNLHGWPGGYKDIKGEDESFQAWKKDILDASAAFRAYSEDKDTDITKTLKWFRLYFSNLWN